MTKKLVITIAVLFSLSTILILNNSFLYEVKKKLNIISAGSYADAEIYQLNYSVEEVKDAIKQFKKEHSEFKGLLLAVFAIHFLRLPVLSVRS